MDIRGSPRLTLFYHVTTAFLLSFLLLPGVFGSFIVSDTDLGLPLLLLAVIFVQAATLWWFDKKVGSTFNPKDVPVSLILISPLANVKALRNSQPPKDVRDAANFVFERYSKTAIGTLSDHLPSSMPRLRSRVELR